MESDERLEMSTLPEEAVISPLQGTLQKPASRLQQRRALNDVLVSLWLALAVSGLVLGAGRLWPLPHWRLWAGLPVALWAVAHLVRYPLLRPSPARTARQLDRELGLKERLATALELEQQDFHSLLAQAQRTDALAHARRVNPTRDLPWHIPRRALALAGGIMAVALLLFFLPNPQDTILQQRAAIRQAAEEQAEQLEALAEKIAEMEGLSSEEREELLRQLDEAAERLRRNQGDAEEAVADLEAVREALRQRLAEREAHQEAVDATEEFLQELAEEIAQGNEEALEAALAGLENLPTALEGMSEEEIAELAGQLAELARRAAADPELARSLEQLAEALEAQDPEAIAAAAEAVTEALEQAEAEIAEQAQVEATLEEALEELAGGETALAEAGGQQGGTGEGATAEGPQEGADAGGEEGTGTGEGSTGEEGMGTGEESTGEGGDWHQDPNRPHEEDAGPPEEEVYVPLGPDGQPAYIPGLPTEGEGDETTILPSLEPEPGEEGVAVPYDAVYRYYQEAAGQAMDRAYIPPGLREYIRSYFSGLEP